jgi:hypothetical protein
MRWRKLGRVFACDGTRAWSRSHTAVPTVGRVDGRVVRVYYTTRDDQKRSHGAWFDLDLDRPDRIPAAAEHPLIGPGPIGRFDDAGAMFTYALTRGEDTWLYYIGWNRGVSVPFRNAVGLAVLGPDGTLHRYAAGPIIDRSPVDPCFVGSVCVRPEGDLWRNWYMSCVAWEERADGLRHRYHLKYATSRDGINWERDGTVCIDFRDDTEVAICQASVHRDGPLYRMWYCYRGDQYRIGYAESADGRRWDRQDHRAGIDVTPGDWDGQMVCYPSVFDAGGSRYMIYNGDGYGATGIGLAVLEQD